MINCATRAIVQLNAEYLLKDSSKGIPASGDMFAFVDKLKKQGKLANGDLFAGLASQAGYEVTNGKLPKVGDDKAARATCERLILLAQESDAPIHMLVSSPGGHVESGDAIHDMIRFVRAPVTTIGSGWVASAGTHIFLAAPPS